MPPRFSSKFLSRRIISYLILASLIYSCDPHPGFDETASGLFKRLEQFGDCQPDLKTADYFILNISYEKSLNPDTSFHIQVHRHKLHSQPRAGETIKEGGLRIMNELDSMKCGDQWTYILPYSEIEQSFLHSHEDSGYFHSQDEIILTIHALRTFNKTTYSEYLTTAAQQAEIQEADAIELLLMNDLENSFERHGDCFIQYLEKMEGDSIKAGNDVTIEYTTYLLNEKKLDTKTELQFVFGRPGQIVGGLQYALSFLRKGESARIYLPSYLAFGTSGNSNGMVPPGTPVIFDLKVIDVRNR